MVIIINDNNSSWWINNYFEYRLCWGFIIPALPALFIYSDYFIENKSLKTSILSGMLLGFIVVISSFFIAFWPYILTMIGLYVLFLSKGKISSKFIFLLSLTFTSSIMQIDNISSAIDLYPISHRSRLDDNLNYFIQNNNIISAALILLKQVFVTFHFHVVLPVIGLIYFYFKSDYKKYEEDIKSILLIFLSFLLLIIIFPFFKYYLNILTNSNIIINRLDFNYIWGVGIKFLILLIYTYFLNIIINEFFNCKRKIQTPAILFVTLYGIFPLIYSNFSYKAKTILDWATNGSIYINYYDPTFVKLKNLINNNNEIVRTLVITGGSSINSLFPNYLNPLNIEVLGGYENLFSKDFGKFYLKTIEPSKKDYNERFIKKHVEKKMYEQAKINDDPVISNYVYYNLKSNENFSKIVNVNLLSLANVKYIVTSKKINSSRYKLKFETPNNNKENLNEIGMSLLNYVIPYLKKNYIFNKLFNPSYSYSLNVLEQNILTLFLGRKLYIYQNSEYLKRFRVVDNFEIVDEKLIFNRLGLSSFEDLKNKVFITKKLDFSNQNKDKKLLYNINVLRYTPNLIELKGNVNKDSILVISNNFSRKWKATLNQLKSPIFKVNGTFIGLIIPKGDFILNFHYQ